MTKDKTIRVLADFLINPEKFGCEIKYIRKDGYSNHFGMIMSGYKAAAEIVVGDVCNHPTLGVVSVRWVKGKMLGVHDGKKEHSVDARECKRIRT